MFEFLSMIFIDDRNDNYLDTIKQINQKIINLNFFNNKKTI